MATPIAPETRIGHVHLKVADLDRAIGFYSGVLGFEVIQQVGTVYLGWVTGSPAGLVFGPVLGLLVAIYLSARLVLFATAWAATRPGAPPPVI